MVKPMNTDRSQSAANAGPDPSWRLLYRVGGVSAWIFVAMVVAAIVIAIATPAPPTADGTATLSYIAAHRTLYIVEQQLWLVPGVFAMVTYLALYPALKHLDRSLAALGAVVGGSAWALTLAIPTTTTGAPALVYLSDQFMAAEALRMVFEGFYVFSGVLLPIWMGAVGWNLYRLGRSSGQVPGAQPAPSPLGADTAEKKVQ